ncbi:peptidoglycan D,D-transpeptidase FtsI family protein [Thermoanaerobacter siderophilus]|uniref:Cell division protein FtsI/penicillin-binding protein 2 n=1 Tax=Thermoanaerobacter siderophilus SR4 TaxID=880478 RepID=I9KRV4_9THEO|nr:penicillin-binding transpeptidase domain-containing protein [Thermoanaerobacter siderophilus]EIV99525.1 cell division protein FtsI/penicillin-binding protein 2 [Thermoanaerobacter siderophilus SR4]
MTSYVKKRTFIIFIFFTIMIFALIVRLIWIQGINSEKLAMAVERQSTADIILKPQRGNIYDVNGNILACNVPAGDVFAAPKFIKNPEKASEELYKYLNMDKDSLYKILSNKNSEWAVLGRSIPLENINKIKSLNIPGIYVEDTFMRNYPNGKMLSQVLGFAGIDGNGLYGLEYSLDKYLSGVPGREISLVDAEGRKVGVPSKLYKPTNGNNIVLTIDSVIQSYTEKAIKNGYEKYKPQDGITAIVMNPKTGEILAMANIPDFDPNNPQKISSQDYWSNPAVSSIYEPGSVFKVITASAALESAVVTPDEQFDDPGYYIVSGHRINSWTKLGKINFEEAIEKSSDTVFMQVVERLGVDAFYKYIQAFGFGTPTGIELPGEASGMILPKSKIYPVDLATMSFGQGIAVTPLQMITAFSAVINGGNLMVPHIVKYIENGDKIIKEYKPQIVRQVISKKTSDTMKYILEKTVTEGTGQAAQVPGYTVGGKTGTTENYAPGKYVASFAGFAPVENPKIAVLVLVKNPTQNGHMGGEVAAPIAQEILRDTLRYYDTVKK